MISINSKLIFIIILLVIFSIQHVFPIGIERIKERPCVDLTRKTVAINSEWFLTMAMKPWYYPLMSRNELYITSMVVTKEEAKEDEIDKSCINRRMHTVTTIGASLVLRGFGGQEATCKLKRLDKKFGAVFITYDGYSAIAFNTLTDNKTFIFTATCIKDINQLTWGVTSPYKSLPKETVRLIYAHAESLGFKKEYFTELKYDSCEK